MARRWLSPSIASVAARWEEEEEEAQLKRERSWCKTGWRLPAALLLRVLRATEKKRQARRPPPGSFQLAVRRSSSCRRS